PQLRDAGELTAGPKPTEVFLQPERLAIESAKAVRDDGPPHQAGVVEWERDVRGGHEPTVSVRGPRHGTLRSTSSKRSSVRPVAPCWARTNDRAAVPIRSRSTASARSRPTPPS